MPREVLLKQCQLNSARTVKQRRLFYKTVWAIKGTKFIRNFLSKTLHLYKHYWIEFKNLLLSQTLYEGSSSPMLLGFTLKRRSPDKRFQTPGVEPLKLAILKMCFMGLLWSPIKKVCVTLLNSDDKYEGFAVYYLNNPMFPPMNAGKWRCSFLWKSSSGLRHQRQYLPHSAFLLRIHLRSCRTLVSLGEFVKVR